MFFALTLLFATLHGKATTELRLHIPSPPNTLDWNQASTSNETLFMVNLMEGLLTYDERNQLVPALAEKWEILDRELFYRFHLKNGVKWSDGVPLTAQHFVDSWTRLKTAQTQSPYVDFLNDIEWMKAKNPTTLEIKLLEPNSLLLHKLTFWVTFPVRLDLLKKHGNSLWTNPQALAVTGAYRLKSTEGTNCTYRLEKNPLYALKKRLHKHSPETACVQLITSHKDARTAFDAGKLDLLRWVRTQDLIRYSRNAKRFPYLTTTYAAANMGKSMFRSREMREALLAALTAEEFPSLLQSGEVLAHGFVPREYYPGLKNIETKTDLFKAQRLLARTGFPDGQGLEELHLGIQDFEGAERLAISIKETFRTVFSLPVKYEITPINQNNVSKFDLIITSWGADYPDPYSFLEIFRSDMPYNLIQFASNDYDQTLKIAKFSLDPPLRQKAFEKLETLLISTHFAVRPLFHRKNTVILGPKIEKLALSPLNYLYLGQSVLKSTQPSASKHSPGPKVPHIQ